MDESVRPSVEEAPSESRGGVREVEIARIRPNPNQPRLQFGEESIDELADSIAERGVLQPILLRPSGRGSTPSRRSCAISTMRRRPRSR
jgi:ParB family chromosome partitioning protein